VINWWAVTVLPNYDFCGFLYFHMSTEMYQLIMVDNQSFICS